MIDIIASVKFEHRCFGLRKLPTFLGIASTFSCVALAAICGESLLNLSNGQWSETPQLFLVAGMLKERFHVISMDCCLEFSSAAICKLPSLFKSGQGYFVGLILPLPVLICQKLKIGGGA